MSYPRRGLRSVNKTTVKETISITMNADTCAHSLVIAIDLALLFRDNKHVSYKSIAGKRTKIPLRLDQWRNWSSNLTSVVDRTRGQGKRNLQARIDMLD